MGWTYQQTTGRLFNVDIAFQCYSGLGDGKNNPDLQWVHGVGPVPVGFYLIGPMETYHPRLGRAVMPLYPKTGTNVFGRSGFYIHGDSTVSPGNGSHGCIVHSPIEDREVIDLHPTRDLEVIR